MQPHPSIWLEDNNPPPPRYRMARFRPGQHVYNLVALVEPFPLNASHQPRLNRHTLLKVLAISGHSGEETLYRCAVLDDKSRPSGYWAILRDSQLAVVELRGWRRWLRSFSENWLGA